MPGRNEDKRLEESLYREKVMRDVEHAFRAMLSDQYGVGVDGKFVEPVMDGLPERNESQQTGEMGETVEQALRRASSSIDVWAEPGPSTTPPPPKAPPAPAKAPKMSPMQAGAGRVASGDEERARVLEIAREMAGQTPGFDKGIFDGPKDEDPWRPVDGPDEAPPRAPDPPVSPFNTSQATPRGPLESPRLDDYQQDTQGDIQQVEAMYDAGDTIQTAAVALMGFLEQMASIAHSLQEKVEQLQSDMEMEGDHEFE